MLDRYEKKSQIYLPPWVAELYKEEVIRPEDVLNGVFFGLNFKSFDMMLQFCTDEEVHESGRRLLSSTLGECLLLNHDYFIHSTEGHSGVDNVKLSSAVEFLKELEVNPYLPEERREKLATENCIHHVLCFLESVQANEELLSKMAAFLAESFA